MKTFFSLLVCTICVGLVSCSKETQEMNFKNSTEEVNVKVVASRESSFDPWTLTMTVKSFERPEALLQAQVFFDELNDETVQMTWEGDYEGYLTVHQRDADPRKFPLVADNKIIHFYEEHSKELIER